jgi:hypothetical protein
MEKEKSRISAGFFCFLRRFAATPHPSACG